MIRWGIIGIGNIAGRFAESLRSEPRSILSAVSSRSQTKADELAEKFSAAKAYAGHDLLLSDNAVDAVYIALPHGFHREFAIRAMKAGKAFLCEKPATLNLAEMLEVAEVARAENVLFMEAMKPRFVPLYRKLKAVLAEGIIGEITGVETSLCNAMNLTGKTYHTQKGQGGALLDVGIYCASWLEDFLGDVRGLEKVTAEVDDTIDYYVDAEMNFARGIGTLECAFDRAKPRRAILHGRNGRIIVDELHRPQSMTIYKSDGSMALIDVRYKVDDFYGEISHFVDCLESGRTESDVMSLSASIGCTKILEIVRKSF